jgi:preprotein translocase subunit YajC
MKLEEPVKKRIIRNALLSLFIYALPVILMILTFYFTGQRPWLKHQNIKKVNQSTVNKP